MFPITTLEALPFVEDPLPTPDSLDTDPSLPSSLSSPSFVSDPGPSGVLLSEAKEVRDRGPRVVVVDEALFQTTPRPTPRPGPVLKIERGALGVAGAVGGFVAPEGAVEIVTTGEGTRSEGADGDPGRRRVARRRAAVAAASIGVDATDGFAGSIF